MTSIRKAKKLGIYVKPSYDKKLYQETLKQIEQVNKRLRSLERGDYYNSYASKKLFNRLDTETLNVLQKSKKGKHVLAVKISGKNLTNTQLKGIQKASRQFLTSKTSTLKGIRNVSEQAKKSMYETLKISSDSNVTKEDIEDYYEMLGSNDFDFFNEKIGASAMWGLMEDAKEMNVNEDGFIKLLNQYITVNDDDVRNRALRLYNKYVI